MSDGLKLSRIAVIGAGLAGRQFALRCMAAGFSVALEDVMPEKLRRAQDAYQAIMPRAGSLRFATEVEDAVSDADLAIDFVPDELESKLEIFCLLDRMAPPRTILLTPTQALSLDDLASCTYRADRCLAVRGDLAGVAVSILRGKVTSDETLVAASSLLTSMGLQGEVVDASTAFPSKK